MWLRGLGKSGETQQKGTGADKRSFQILINLRKL
jgi:hypothetical protein